jgi:hypothetical protein
MLYQCALALERALATQKCMVALACTPPYFELYFAKKIKKSNFFEIKDD